MKTPLRVLLIEDNDDDAELVLRTVSRGGFDIIQCSRVETETEFRAQIEQDAWDIILSDYHLPHFDANQALTLLTQHLTATGQDIPFLVISGTIGEETAVAMMKAGAADYLLKDRLSRLPPAISRELREAAVRRDRNRLETALRESEEARHSFLRDVLRSATEGRLHLCDSPTELPLFLGSRESVVSLSTASLSELRSAVRGLAQSCGFPEDRQMALMSSAGEAAMNAIVHGVGGTVCCGSNATGTAQVWIDDNGTGISMINLPRATLERGFTTAGTMGVGFHIILQSCDRVYLLTGPEGTTVVLEMDKEAPLPPWLTDFAR